MPIVAVLGQLLMQNRQHMLTGCAAALLLAHLSHVHAEVEALHKPAQLSDPLSAGCCLHSTATCLQVAAICLV